MKKLFIFAAVAAMFASCSSENDDYIAQDKPQKIVFESPVMNKTSRAAITGTTYPIDESFTVYAQRHTNAYASGWSNNFMGGVDVTKDAVEAYWEPVADYYWPKNGDFISFAAHSPASLKNGEGCTTIAYSATGLKVDGYLLNSVLANQTDLLYAERQLNKMKTDMVSSTDKNPYYGLTIPFKHAMSLINFTVKSANSNVVLKKITVKDACDKGTFNETITDGGTYSSKPAWSAQGFQAGSNSTFEVFSGNQAVTGSAVGVPSEAPANLLMIPQGVGSSKVTIEWTYQNGGIATPVNDDITINFSDLSIDTWAIGKKYTYNIVINLDKIYFNPTVEDWDDGSGTEPNPNEAEVKP